MNDTFAFRTRVHELERFLVSALELAPFALPPEHATMRGHYRGEPVELRARAYRGERVRYARFVELEGAGLEIGNVLCVPSSDLELPMFGVDLVNTGRDTAVIVADLSPVNERASLEHPEHANLRARLSGRGELTSAGELPGWAREWFSHDALFVRASRAQRELVAALLLSYAAVFTDMFARTERAPAVADAVGARHAAYMAAHRLHDRGLALLERVFEPLCAARFLRDVLFPERLPS